MKAEPQSLVGKTVSLVHVETSFAGSEYIEHVLLRFEDGSTLKVGYWVHCADDANLVVEVETRS